MHASILPTCVAARTGLRVERKVPYGSPAADGRASARVYVWVSVHASALGREEGRRGEFAISSVGCRHHPIRVSAASLVRLRTISSAFLALWSGVWTAPRWRELVTDRIHREGGSTRVRRRRKARPETFVKFPLGVAGDRHCSSSSGNE